MGGYLSSLTHLVLIKFPCVNSFVGRYLTGKKVGKYEELSINSFVTFVVLLILCEEIQWP